MRFLSRMLKPFSYNDRLPDNDAYYSAQVNTRYQDGLGKYEGEEVLVRYTASVGSRKYKGTLEQYRLENDWFYIRDGEHRRQMPLKLVHSIEIHGQIVYRNGQITYDENEADRHYAERELQKRVAAT